MKLPNFSRIAVAISAALAGSVVSAQTADAPPTPKAGECYARVVTPAKFDTVSEQVVRAPATKRSSFIPAKMGTVDEQELVRAGAKRVQNCN
jgi:hypothetical protein